MRGASFRIRELRLSDYAALIASWKEAGLPHRPKGRDARTSIARQLRSPTTVFLVAEIRGRLAGTVLGTHDGRKGWINRLAVAPEYRRRGVAAALVAEVERRLHRQGIDIIAALIEDWNMTSMKAFRRLGYRPRRDIMYFVKRRKPEV